MQKKCGNEIKAAQLRVRMRHQAATPHRRPVRPSEKEQRMVAVAIDMLMLIQMMPYVMYDIREELERAGQYRHAIKRRHRQAEEIIFAATEPAYQVFARYSHAAASGFLERMDQLYQQMKSNSNPHGLESSVSMLEGICRLVERYNRQLEPTYYFDHADPLYKLPQLLDCIPVERHNIAGVIEYNLRIFNEARIKKD